MVSDSFILQMCIMSYYVALGTRDNEMTDMIRSMPELT